MISDPSTDLADDRTHLSDGEARRITRHDGAPELASFVSALQMQRPATPGQVAQLLEHVIKESMSANAALLEGQMRTDHWEHRLSDGETLTIVAERAQLFLDSPDGIHLFNLFARTFAKTTGEMFGSEADGSN
jgi:hypothetical protein